MKVEKKIAGSPHRLISRLTLLAFAVVCVLHSPHAAQAQSGIEPPSGMVEADEPEQPPHMPEAQRALVKQVVVIASRSPAGQEVGGSYEKDTAGLMGGMAAGSRIGRISKQVGPVPVVIPIPILTLPGVIFGGLSGAAKREIQEFRDALTEDLATAESQPMTDDGLALDVFWAVRKLPMLDSKIISPTTPMPDDTDAILYVTYGGIGIDVQGKEAIITTTAEATLRRESDSRELYETMIAYQDRDTLRNWTADDNALWRDYINYARHYLGREVAADVFDRIEIQQALLPKETETAQRSRKNEREFVSESLRPTLAWELELASNAEEGAWTAALDESGIFYDVEIYDQHQLVYAEEQVPAPRHTLAMDLEPCATYRWSVRPSFRVAGDMRFGDWMRLEPAPDTGKKKKKKKKKGKAKDKSEDSKTSAEVRKGIVGRQASATPAYTQDFPTLRIACSRR